MCDEIDVFIVLIGSKTLNSNVKVGAVYADAKESMDEKERLNKANPYTDAWVVRRTLKVKPAEPDDEIRVGKSASDNGIFERGVKRRKAERKVIEAAQAWLPWAESRILMRPEELRIVEALEALAELERK